MVLDQELFKYFAGKPLLGDGRFNTKMDKNETVTFYLALNPYKQNSLNFNLCQYATKECVAGCLVHSGKNIMAIPTRAREYRTELFIRHREYFLIKLWQELYTISKTYDKALIRLNTYSDIDWEKEFIGMNSELKLKIKYSLSNFPNLQFYNYTKVPAYVENNIFNNVHFTFSYSGYNWSQCEQFLREGKCNVAVVFYPHVPETYKGFTVINGDETDERLSTKEGVGKIVGLRYKTARMTTFNPNNNPFIILNKEYVEC